MKIHYKNSNPSTPTRINHYAGDPDESYFDHTQLNPNGDPVDGELIHGHNPAYYDIVSGELVPKDQVDVDQIILDRGIAAQQILADRATRRAIGKGHAINGIPNTQPEQQEAIDLLYQILDDNEMLD